MKSIKFGFGALALAALIAGGCAKDKATTCESDKACTDKSSCATSCEGAAKKTGCCKDGEKAPATNAN
jgi:hypothetical protein